VNLGTKILIGAGVLAAAGAGAYALNASAKEGKSEPKGTKVRRPVQPDPQDASWKKLKGMAVLSTGSQWRFAVPDSAKKMFTMGNLVSLGLVGSEGPFVAEAETLETGFNLIPRVGPTVSYSNESGVLTIFSANYHGPFTIEASGSQLHGWILSPDGEDGSSKAEMTERGHSWHIVDVDMRGQWAMHAEARDAAGKLVARTSGYFDSKELAQAAGDKFIDERGAMTAEEIQSELDEQKTLLEEARKELEDIKKDAGLA